MQDGRQESSQEQRESPAYWPRVRRVTAVLLVVWLLATVVGPWFARDLAQVHWFGFPLSFWAASQGALLVYLAIIVVYSLWMDRLEASAAREAAAPDAAPCPPESSAQARGADAASEGADE
jgi:putative solute:sodium symporter small subunit